MKIRDSVVEPVVVSPPPASWDIDCQAAGDGLTKQEFAKDCDVNEILKRCLKMGLPLPGSDVQAVYADVSQIGDYADCVRRVKAAEDTFLSLPADLRARFGNDPTALVAFVSDDANIDEARKLGLLPPLAAVEPVKAPLAADAAVVPPK